MPMQLPSLQPTMGGMPGGGDPRLAWAQQNLPQWAQANGVSPQDYLGYLQQNPQAPGNGIMAKAGVPGFGGPAPSGPPMMSPPGGGSSLGPIGVDAPRPFDVSDPGATGPGTGISGPGAPPMSGGPYPLLPVGPQSTDRMGMGDLGLVGQDPAPSGPMGPRMDVLTSILRGGGAGQPSDMDRAGAAEMSLQTPPMRRAISPPVRRMAPTPAAAEVGGAAGPGPGGKPSTIPLGTPGGRPIGAPIAKPGGAGMATKPLIPPGPGAPPEFATNPPIAVPTDPMRKPLNAGGFEIAGGGRGGTAGRAPRARPARPTKPGRQS